MKVTEVHRVESFKEKPCVEPYLNRNTRKMPSTEDKPLQTFHKLLYYASYGKTMAIIGNRLKLNFIKTECIKELFNQP